jgi:hypothetical protein
MKNKDKKKAIDVLLPFNEVKEKKNTISSLTNNPTLFFQALKYYKNHQYREFIKLSFSNSSLKETPEYNKILKYIDSLKLKIDQTLKANNLKDTLLLSKQLLEFPSHKEYANSIITIVKQRLQLDTFINNYNYYEAFDIINKNYILTDSYEFNRLKKEFNKIELQAYKMLLLNPTKDILNLFLPYINYTLLKPKIASFIKISYINEVLKIPQEDIDRVDWKYLVEHYSVYFGIDEDIKLLLKKFNKEKFIYKVIGATSHDGYKKVKFIDTLIRYKTEEEILEEKLKAKQEDKGLLHLYLILSGGIIAFAILVVLLINIFKTDIENYKQKRKSTSVYTLFEKIYKATTQ